MVKRGKREKSLKEKDGVTVSCKPQRNFRERKVYKKKKVHVQIKKKFVIFSKNSYF